MKNNAAGIGGIAAVLIVLIGSVSHAQDFTHVRIRFDELSKRIDIVSGKKLPDYSQAERGSLRFYRGRLDSPEEGFAYFFDGRSFQGIKGLALLRKMPGPGAWAIVGSRGWRGAENATVSTNPLTVCEIEHHAVSFIPINPKTEKPESRVYVLLDDLYLIQWKVVDHWVATMGQAEFDAAQGRMY